MTLRKSNDKTKYNTHTHTLTLPSMNEMVFIFPTDLNNNMHSTNVMQTIINALKGFFSEDFNSLFQSKNV